LDKPVAVQYFTYVGNLLNGYLWFSFQHEIRSVTNFISIRVGPSVFIGFQLIILGFILWLVLGVISALKHNTIYDYGSVFLAVIGMSIPNFVFAALMQYFIGVKLGWLPVALWKDYYHSIMPTIALSVMVIATVARFIRTEVLEVLGQDYVLTARAIGLCEVVVIIKHVLRNALISVVTVVGSLAVSIMTGTLVIEQIFAVPGLGGQFTLSILVNDYSVIIGITLFFSVLFLFVLFFVDFLFFVLFSML